MERKKKLVFFHCGHKSNVFNKKLHSLNLIYKYILCVSIWVHAVLNAYRKAIHNPPIHTLDRRYAGEVEFVLRPTE